MAWRRFKSTIPASTGSPVFFSAWVNFKSLSLYLHSKMRPAALHPYYKLEYIGLAWGRVKEQEEEQASGDQYAKNWQDKVMNYRL
jgi:hypothetical protein